jgi:hypothetical protein
MKFSATPERLIKREEVFRGGAIMSDFEDYRKLSCSLPVAYDGLLFVKSIADGGREVGAEHGIGIENVGK